MISITNRTRSERVLEFTLLEQQRPIVYISDEALLIFKWIFLCVLISMLAIAGAISNLINIFCFVKQGFKDSVNINFLALAISDLGSLVTTVLTMTMYIPLLEDIDLSFDAVEMIVLTVGWPHILFSRITGWVTALITMERCLCITMPLKVKLLFTPKRAVITNVSLYIIIISCVSPIYYANSFGWKFSPERNKTILGLVFTPDREQVEQIGFILNHAVLSFSAFLCVTLCTIILVINLQKKSKWRNKSTGAEQAEKISDRDQKLGRIIVIIASLFIISYIPMCLTFVAAMFVPGMSVDGHNFSLLAVCGGIGALLETVNSSVNIFVYYSMSSKYRQVFSHLFHCLERKTSTSKSTSNLV